MGKAQGRRTLQPKITASLPAQSSEANLQAQPNRAGASPASARQNEKDFQDDKNKKNTVADPGGGGSGDDQRGGVNSVGDSRSGVKLENVAPRPAETEVKNAAETETERGDFPAGSGSRPVAPGDADLRPGGRLAVGGGEDSLSESQSEPAQSVASADKSVSPVSQTDLADKSVESADKSVSKVLDFSGFRSRRLTSQSVADFDKRHWKRSRIKSGWLIRRLTGYSIVENEYGVQYLGVVSRKPDRMSADSLEYPLAGFFIWSVMAERSLLVEERGQHARTKLG